MKFVRPASVLLIALATILSGSASALATGVPIAGFSPLVGIALTNEFKDDLDFFAHASPQPGGLLLGNSGAHYDLALLDTGAAASLLSTPSDVAFNIDGPYSGEPDGFRGTEPQPIIGAAGNVTALINDPVGLYAGGLQGRSLGGGTFTMDHGVLKGQTNTSLATLPVESDLPNILGLPFASQYATYIRNDLPQVFTLAGRTVRAPAIEFLPLGSGGSQGITRRAPLALNPAESFQLPPFWFYNDELDIDNPHEDPKQPTVVAGGLYLNISAQNEGEQISNFQFLFDTGADVTVVSQLNAVRLGFDPVTDEPDFTIAVIGAGGTINNVPGFFADSFTVQAVGGSITQTNVPIIVLNLADPANSANFIDGIVGTNFFSGRNLVIDPQPATGGGTGPNLYVSDPITNQKDWSSPAASATFATGSNWSGNVAPGNLSVVNLRHVSGGNQTAAVNANTNVWEVNVSGGAGGQTMTLQLQSGVTLTTFSGTNIEQRGVVELQNATVDTQYVEIFAAGELRGSGSVRTGSGPIPGQVENRGGTISPGNGIGQLSIVGHFANGTDGTLAMQLGGFTPGTGYDQLAVDGTVALRGTLSVSLLNVGPSFTPGVGDVFHLITSTESVGGAFEQLSLPPGYNWRIAYQENSVDLVIGIPGDYNDNGTVDAADYTVWRNTLHSTTNWDADGNGNGVIDTGDFVVWKNHFGSTEGSGSAVPEPASASLIILAMLSFVAAWTRGARSVAR